MAENIAEKPMNETANEDTFARVQPLLEECVLADVMRLSTRLDGATLKVLKPNGVTPQQYNVLRILRGAGRDGLSCMEIGRRMITRVPDVPRLIDRLVSLGWAERERSKKDGRVAVIRITRKGAKLLNELHDPITEMNKKYLGPLGDERLRALRDLLQQTLEIEVDPSSAE